jgi:hypothetical protein
MRANEFTNKQIYKEGQAFVSDEVWRHAKHLAHRIEKRVENFGHREIAMIAHEVGLSSNDVAEILELSHGIEEEQFCEECGGSLAESGKASRALCKSSRSNADLGVSQLASCKSQGLRARETPKKHTIGNKRVKIKGKHVKGHKYGGPLPYNKSDD